MVRTDEMPGGSRPSRRPPLLNLAGLAFTLALVGACSPSNSKPTPRALPELARAEDLNPDPKIFEVNLVAQVAGVEYLPGKPTKAWTYNGTVPGPLVEARVGDELLVHFRNELPEPTTIHWHGLRVPAAMDGTVAMQQPIPSGGSFEYRFVLKDAGLYWFHPHVRSDEQVERGLYGVILVRGDSEPELGAERVLVLDDVLLNSDGSLVDSSQMGSMMEMTGRQGNVLLANGVPDAVLDLKPGERVRLRVVNTANARYFNLTFGGRPMTLVGVDGGLLERPRQLERILLTPGERIDVLLQANGQAGEVLELMNAPYERGHDTGFEQQRPVLRLKLLEGSAVATEVPASLRQVPPLSGPTQLRRFVLTEEMGGHAGHGSMVPIFKINGEAFPNITSVQSTLNAVEEWEIVNDTEMDHPFHLHGFFFQVTSAGGVTETERAWKDTVNVRGKSNLKFLVRFDDHPGTWMYHCHILEHAERGMMGELVVGP